jgi:inner membrane protein
MLLKSHLVIAFFCFFFLFNYLPGNKILFAISFFLSTFLVDVDSTKSKIGNHWYLRPLQWLISHRGVIHSLLFGFVFSLIVFLVNKDFGVGLFFGWTLHLIVDCFTAQGVDIFWPFEYKIKIIGVSSGGIFEQIIFVLFLLADFGLIIRLIF